MGPSQGQTAADGPAVRTNRRAPAARQHIGGTHADRGQAGDLAELREELSRNPTLIVSEYRGLNVSDLAEIRRSLRKHNVTYRVVKNRLMRIAAGTDAGREALSPLLNGPTAIAFGSGDEAVAAKAVIDATKPYKMVKLKGAVLGDQAIDADGLTRLAALPSRTVLLAQLAGAIAAPIADVAGLLAAPLRDLATARPWPPRSRSAADAAYAHPTTRDVRGPPDEGVHSWPRSPRTIFSMPSGA